MVRREDPNWGADAVRANDDTFHYTNAAFQHSSLNQGKMLWQGLENYILNSARTQGFQATVFTGPIFRDDDPELSPSKAKVPLEFWKIVAMPSAEGGLHATAYLLSQGDLIRDLLADHGHHEAAEGFVLGAYRTFQVAVAHIENATGLDFRSLRDADPMTRSAGLAETIEGDSVVYRPIYALEDVILERARVRTLPRPDATFASLVTSIEALAHEARSEGARNVLEQLIALQDTQGVNADDVAALCWRYRAAVAGIIGLEEIAAPGYASVKAEYEQLFANCEIRANHAADAAWYVSKLNSFKGRYEAVGATLGIPWWFVGITHALEGTFNFKGHLHNGDPLTARTVQVPRGRPLAWNPPNDWESSAVDALIMKGYAGQTDWSVPRSLYRFEAYNGWGYRGRGIHTPYLWSFSNQYSKGKYTADGHYDPNAVSKQCGAAAILKLLLS
jgi:lysozyme family protein